MVVGRDEKKSSKSKGGDVEVVAGKAVEEESGQNKKQKQGTKSCRCHQHQLSNWIKNNNTIHNGITSSADVTTTAVFCEICTPHKP